MLADVVYNFIVYIPGYAGNFLQRVFSLSPSVTPVVTRGQLSNWIVSGVVPSNELFDFTSVNTKYADWQAFHNDYSSAHTLVVYPNLLSKFNQYTHVVTQIHPHELVELRQPLISRIPAVNFMYVDLDLGIYNRWWETSKKELGFELRPGELALANELKQSMQSISLTAILSSEEGFVQEYVTGCDIFKLEPCIDYAIHLYRSWKSVRAKC